MGARATSAQLILAQHFPDKVDIKFQNNSVIQFCISHKDVRKPLNNINANKGHGPAAIHGKIIKNCSVSIYYPLSLVYTKTGLIPDEWKLAHVVPVHKNEIKHLCRIIGLFP